jgi:broad specificity phosphatase PhoE
MIEIYLIRHGQTEWNSKKRFQGQLDIQLDETGIRQAKQLSERLEDVHFDAVYSSDLKRAHVTASALCEKRNQGINIIPDLKEVCFGLWEGRAIHEVMTDKHSGGCQWFNNPSSRDIPGGETVEQIMTRIDAVIDQVLDRHSEGRVALVTHGNLIRYFLLKCLKFPDELFSRTDIGNTSINILRWENDNFHLHCINDCSHL